MGTHPGRMCALDSPSRSGLGVRAATRRAAPWWLSPAGVAGPGVLILTAAVVAGAAAALLTGATPVWAAVAKSGHAPGIVGPTPNVVYFSPNGDGVRDTASATVRLAVAGRLTATVVSPSGRTVATLASGRRVPAGTVRLTWSGRAGTTRRPDGAYALKAWFKDSSGTRAKRWPATGRLVIDTTKPTVHLVGVAPTPFSPNGDGRRDSTAMTVTGNEALSGTLNVYSSSGTRMATRQVIGGRTMSALWNGKDDAGHVVADGAYRLRLVARDRAGNPAAPLEGRVVVDRTPPQLTLGLSDTTCTPNGDGTQDAVRIELSLGDGASYLTRTVTSPSSRTLSSWRRAPAGAGSYDSTFDGTFTDGSTVTSLPTGGYKVTATAQDAAGNRIAKTATIHVDSYTLVVLDPGHGGLVGNAYDTGAVGYSAFDPRVGGSASLLESVLNLQIAMGRMDGTVTAQEGVAQFLRESTATGQEIRVRLTRTREREPGLTLERRAYIANLYGPSVFMIIHNNDASNRDAIGTETLYNPSSTRGKYLAARVQRRVGQEVAASHLNPGWMDRGLKDGTWLYLSGHVNVPWALVEGGFVNNPVENKLLRTDAYRQALAKGIAEGVTDYLITARTKGWL